MASHTCISMASHTCILPTQAFARSAWQLSGVSVAGCTLWHYSSNPPDSSTMFISKQPELENDTMAASYSTTQQYAQQCQCCWTGKQRAAIELFLIPAKEHLLWLHHGGQGACPPNRTMHWMQLLHPHTLLDSSMETKQINSQKQKTLDNFCSLSSLEFFLPFQWSGSAFVHPCIFSVFFKLSSNARTSWLFVVWYGRHVVPLFNHHSNPHHSNPPIQSDYHYR